MTIQEALRSITNYPIPQRTLQRVAAGAGYLLDDVITAEEISSPPFKIAEARLKLWLASAPNISEGGVSFSFSESERRQLRSEAESILSEEGLQGPRHGYKGEYL